MQLPAAVRAYVGLIATGCDEVRRLPDRIVELPMQLVSSTLRAQQRYTRLVARGDEVLQREPEPSEEPPEWATFDDPVDDDALRNAARHASTPARSPSKFDLAAEGDAPDGVDD